MQFRLSTLFLVFFTVAASLACYGPWGLLVALSMILAALSLKYAEYFGFGVVLAFLFFFIVSLCSGLIPAIISAREEVSCLNCIGHLKQIGVALLNYHDIYKHFPSVYKCDKNGNRLFSWHVQVLPMLEYRSLYNALMTDEPWNSPYNIKVLSQFPIESYKCPSVDRNKSDFSTNYMAVIGPGTAWRDKNGIKFSDLPDGGSHTVMAVEVVNSGVHWAEPCDLTVDEALERMKTGKGLRISTNHPSKINVLFADSSVHSLPAKMPISLWRKILAGEVKDVENIWENIDESAPDMVNLSVFTSTNDAGQWTRILGLIIWLISVVLLFRRAMISRRKPMITT